MIPRITSTALLAVLVLAMAAGAAPAEPVLSVNGQNIDSSKLYDYMVRRHGYPSLLKLLVAEAIDQAATAAGITITDEEIAAEVAARRESLDRTAIESGVDFDQMLLSRGQTVEMFSDGERTLLQLRKMVADDVNITDETLATYYQGHPDEFRLKE
ncbi:MAG TPA: hypothetical protein QGH10_25640, partial [Armatimonadota bacterium]|nr:hypothetical protein [Armatimonadota bacterium]